MYSTVFRDPDDTLGDLTSACFPTASGAPGVEEILVLTGRVLLKHHKSAGREPPLQTYLGK
jgi:hypothetical protein